MESEYLSHHVERLMKRKNEKSHNTNQIFQQTSFLSPIFQFNKQSQTHRFSFPNKIKLKVSRIKTEKERSPYQKSFHKDSHSRKIKSQRNESFLKMENKKRMLDEELLKKSEKLIDIKEEFSQVSKQSSELERPVRRMINEYKILTEQILKEKRKRSRNQKIKCRLSKNSEKAQQSVHPVQRNPNQDLVKMIRQNDEKMNKTFYHVKTLEYQGSQDMFNMREQMRSIQESQRNQWKAQLNLTQKINFKQKNSIDKKVESKSNSSKKDSFILERLSYFQKEIELIRKGKMESNSLYIKNIPFKMQYCQNNHEEVRDSSKSKIRIKKKEKKCETSAEIKLGAWDNDHEENVEFFQFSQNEENPS